MTTSQLIGRRQVHKASKRWDARSAAEELAEQIMARREDHRLRWLPDGRLDVQTRLIIPSGVRRTTEGRRKRFNAELAKILTVASWTRKGRYWLPP
jgi:hypothetical protein